MLLHLFSPLRAKTMKTSCQYFLLGILYLFAMTTSSCHKEKTYVLSGKMMEQCGGASMANHELNVSYRREYSWVSSYQNVPSAGSGKTDANGNFEFGIRKEYNNGEWTLTDKTTGMKYYFDLNTASKSKLSLGVIYRDSVQYKAEVTISITNKINVGDTLYLFAGGQIKTVFPVFEKSYKLNFEISRPQPLSIRLPNKTINESIQWSVGNTNFKQIDSMRLSVIKFNPCHFPVYQNNVTINP